MRRFKVRSLAQVWPGDVLTLKGRVTDLVRNGIESGVELELVALREPDEVVAEASASFVLVVEE